MLNIHAAIVRFLLLISLAVLAACSVPADVDEPTVPMGDFVLGHNIVVVNEPQIGPFSRKASDDKWQEELTAGIARRFDVYEGAKIYNFGISIDAYALALPGVPLVFTPKSFLIITATIWDDAEAAKLNEEAKQLTIFEGISGETLVSSGLTQNKRQQMVKLSDNAAKAVQDWLLENPEWFGLPPLPEEVPDEDF